MLGRFGRDAGSLLGVEIASDSIRMLHLHRRQGRHGVSAWAVEPFETPLEHWAAQPEVVAGALRRACQRSGSRQRLAAVALPGSEVISKVCRLPAQLSEGEMEAHLWVDAERLFPFPLQDLALDFQVLGPAAGHADEVNVLVGACPQRLLAPLEQVFDSAGLEVVAVEVDSLALHRALAPVCNPAVALLRIEAGCATLHRWPEPSMPQRLELRLAAAQGQAQRLELIGQWLRSALPATSIECLRIACGDRSCDGWSQALTQHLAVPCESLWPFAGLDLTGVVTGKGLSRNGPALALAYGLALGGADRC